MDIALLKLAQDMADFRQRAHPGVDTLAADRVAIASGLEGVAAVVTDGAAYLDDGAAVTVRP